MINLLLISIQQDISMWKFEQEYLDCVYIPVGFPYWVISKVIALFCNETDLFFIRVQW